MTGAEIPMTAWQQAVIVVLFCLFVLSLFAFIRWLLGWVAKLQAQWQTFMEKRESVWQSWLAQRETESNEALKGVTEALKELACEVREHDAKVDKRIIEATQVVTGKRPPVKRV